MTASSMGADIAAGRRVVIKVGSSLLVDEARGTVHRQWLESLSDDVAAMRDRGQEVILVSSGAVAVGRRHLGLATGALSLQQKQAAAAAGMVRLVHAYQEVMGRFGITVAQILLTLDDSEDRRRYLNARNTLYTLLACGALPLINENDTVATDEIRFGDNDRLAARVAAMVGADTLVLLSDIDGLYTADPGTDAGARFIPEVREMTPEILAMAGEARTGYGSGGMVTKLAAARICLGAGCRMVIAKGKEMNPIARIGAGARATWFLPQATPSTARKRWIQGSLKPAGALLVDAGAEKALKSGRSLLPAGVVEIEGDFRRGELVRVLNAERHEIARGLIDYSAEETRAIMGRRSAEIEQALGYRRRDELIHRDDLVLG